MYRLVRSYSNNKNGFSWIKNFDKITNNFFEDLSAAKLWFEKNIHMHSGYDRRKVLIDRRTHEDRRGRITNFDRRQNEIGRRYTDYINFYSEAL